MSDNTIIYFSNNNNAKLNNNMFKSNIITKLKNIKEIIDNDNKFFELKSALIELLRKTNDDIKLVVGNNYYNIDTINNIYENNSNESSENKDNSINKIKLYHHRNIEQLSDNSLESLNSNQYIDKSSDESIYSNKFIDKSPFDKSPFTNDSDVSIYSSQFIEKSTVNNDSNNESIESNEFIEKSTVNSDSDNESIDSNEFIEKSTVNSAENNNQEDNIEQTYLMYSDDSDEESLILNAKQLSDKKFLNSLRVNELRDIMRNNSIMLSKNGHYLKKNEMIKNIKKKFK
jgi:hypothetical protein